MPLYTYQHPETGETKDVLQSMKDTHEYSEGGVAWKRIWGRVDAGISLNIDPFSERAFQDKVDSGKGTMGDIWDRSRELSEKRAAKRDGVDPVREKYFRDYEKKRDGKRHPQDPRLRSKITI